MLPLVKNTLLEQLIQQIASAVWNRPELTPLREPIETAIRGNEFKLLAEKALTTFAETVTLPGFFDAEFITQSPVLDVLSAYIVEGKPADVDELLRRYSEYIGEDKSGFREIFAGYLKTLRETFSSHPTFGPLLLSRDVQSIYAVVNLLRTEMLDGFQLVVARFDELRREPEIKALIERKTSHHVFLSYTRADILTALKIRNALEEAGHSVWQDTTAIKTGADWIESIEDGIERSYALVSVVSHHSQQSRWVKIEYLHAQRRNKPIYPIKVDDCEIPTLMLLDNVALAHPHLEGGLGKLLGELPSVPAVKTIAPAAPALNPGEQEIKYLDGLLLEHSVWQELYTPMAGVAQMRKAQPQTQKPQMRTVPHAIESQFKARMKALKKDEPIEIEQKSYTDILPAVRELGRLVILGDPGAGKSTTLWRIAADTAERAKRETHAPLPVLVRLGELGSGSLRTRIEAQLGELAPFYDTLLGEKRLLFLLDGLNEMPAERRTENLAEIKTLVQHCEQQGMAVAITCREHDYTALDLHIPEKVIITPLDPPRIHHFVNGYITDPPGAGDALFWELAGKTAYERWQEFSEKVGETLEIFWLAESLPNGKRWGWGFKMYENRNWEDWLKTRQQPRSMLQLATNPFMLYMITQVYTEEEGHLPPNRGSLFKLFVDFLLEDREKLPMEVALILQDRLADLGYEMQRQGEGTTFSRADALIHLGDEVQLTRALSASLLTGSDEIRFTHQLLQEYFAAKRLDREMHTCPSVLASRDMGSAAGMGRNGNFAGGFVQRQLHYRH